MNSEGVWLSLLFPLAGVAAILAFRALQRSITHARQCAGVQQLISLKALLVLTQRHRGASYGAINGEQTLRDALPAIEQQMENHIRELAPLSEHGPQQDHWLAFCDHWSRLQKNNLQLGAENNLAQHNQLIGVLLYLLEDVAESSRLNEVSHESLQHLWRDLPRTAELIGQARVLGSGIMAAGNTDSVHKIRMRFVRAKLEEFLTQSDQSHEKLQELMNVIDLQILQESAQPMGARAYFDLSSAAMEPFFRRIDKGLECLKQRLGVL